MKYFICNNYKYIIFWSPKTGHTAMFNLLSQIYKKKINTHNTEILTPEKYKNYIIILLFRNPYNRLVSSFRHYIKDKKYNITFNEFVNNFQKYNKDHHVYGQCTETGYEFYKLIIKFKKEDNYIFETSKNLNELYNILSKITGKQLTPLLQNNYNNSNDKIKNKKYNIYR